MKKVILVLLGIVFCFSIFSQESNYNISIQLKGYTDSIAYLGNYYGDKLAISDTSSAFDGEIVFRGTEPLKQGVYFLVGMKHDKLFEFLIGDDQEFQISSSLNAPPDQTTFTGSDENELFYTYLDYNRRSYMEMKSLRSTLASLPPGNDSIPVLRAQMEDINNESIDYKLNIISKHPNSVIAVLFNVMREPEVPDFFTADGRHDSLASYLYYRKHYWEYVNIGDDRFLRTPVFSKKLERYLDEVLSGHPDTLIKEIDRMIALTDEQSEMRTYLLWHITNKYETSRVMSYDKIFVHMANTYFTDRDYEWLHPTVRKNMLNRAKQLQNVLIGSPAPPLIMGDTGMQFRSLYEVEAEYTIVLFWSSSCGECKKEVETIKEYCDSIDIDMKIYAVNTDTTSTKWKKFIERKKLDWINVNGNLSLTGDYHQLYDIYSTPVIYLLNNEKAIIAKRLSADKLPAVIDRYRDENLSSFTGIRK